MSSRRAVRPTGTYTVEGNNVAVRITLRRDGVILARLQVEGAKSDLATLADKLAKAILAVAK